MTKYYPFSSTYDPNRIALGLKTIAHVEGNRFRLPMLESHTDGELDILAGDKYAANMIWTRDAVWEHEQKYKVLHDWIKEHCPGATFEVAWLDGWDCENIEGFAWADELFGMPYEIVIPSDLDARVFKARWL